MEIQINNMLKSGHCNVDLNKIKVIRNLHDNDLKSLIKAYDLKNLVQLHAS